MADRTVYQQPIYVPSGIDGLELVSIPLWTIDDLLPIDSQWSVILAGQRVGEQTVALQRCRFRTLHAAAHMALRLNGVVDWTTPYDELQKAPRDQAVALGAAMRHAEAHGHEIDAAYPAGRIIPMGNGPSIVDHAGTAGKAIAGAPDLRWEHDGDDYRCSVCGQPPRVRYEWMSHPPTWPGRSSYCPECGSRTANGCGAAWHGNAPATIDGGCDAHGVDRCPLCGPTKQPTDA